MWKKLHEGGLYSSWTNVKACTVCYFQKERKTPCLCCTSRANIRAKITNAYKKGYLAKDTSNALRCLDTHKSLTSCKTLNFYSPSWKGLEEGTIWIFCICSGYNRDFCSVLPLITLILHLWDANELEVPRGKSKFLVNFGAITSSI